MAEFNSTSGYLVSHTVSAGSTNATVVKAIPGVVYRILFSNINAAARYLKLHNTPSAPTAGTTTVALTIPGPAASSQFIDFGDEGVRFSSGIAFTTTTELADNGTTAISASESVIDIYYR